LHPKIAQLGNGIAGSNAQRAPQHKLVGAARRQAKAGLHFVCHSEPLGKVPVPNLSGAQPIALNTERDISTKAVSPLPVFGQYYGIGKGHGHLGPILLPSVQQS